MTYQFCVDGRGAGPVRSTWEQAAQDMVDAGYAVWTEDGEVRHDAQAGIARYDK